MNRISTSTIPPYSLAVSELKQLQTDHDLQIDTCLLQNDDTVSLETAIIRLSATLKNRQSVHVPLIKALNQVLATPLIAPNAFPPFDRAMMDGYAARFSDLCTKSMLDIAGESAAGRAYYGVLDKGTVVAIATGAPMPEGADCVIRKEYARVEANKIFVAVELLCPGSDYEPRGAVVMPGDVLIPSKTRLQPAHLAIAARHGINDLEVHRPLRIQILLIGDELIPAGNTIQQGQIYEHNQILIASFLAQHHGEILLDLPIVPDDEAEIRLAVQAVLNTTPPPDLILLVGGTSVGNHDHTRTALATFGSWLFLRLDLRPGRPTCALKTRQGVPIIALPGSPKAVTALLPRLIAPLLNT